MARFNTIKDTINVITGSGSGLGAATLRYLLRRGSGPILAIDRQFSPNFIESLNLEKEDSDKIVLEEYDTFDENLEKPLSKFVKDYGRIDNLLNIAGIAGAYLLYPKTTKKVYDYNNAATQLNFNTVGTFNTTRLVSKFMIDDYFETSRSTNIQSRCIINVGCYSTTIPTLGQTFYAGTKSSIDSMTLCLARELAPYNIRCNTISVGFFDTPLVRCAGDLATTYIQKVSLCPKRLGRPEEFAHLCSSIIRNQMINGVCIKIDGGTRVPANW